MNVIVSLSGMDALLVALVLSAARRAFPKAVVTSCPTLAEVWKSEWDTGLGFLVMANPDQNDATQALQAMDRTGLPRWEVVILGTDIALEGVDSIPPEEWNEALLARIFRSAAARHPLHRLNERMRGDLQTWARRVNHDLRTPLGGIVGASEVLTEILGEKTPASVGLTKAIFQSVGDLEKLLERVSLMTKASVNPLPKTTVLMGELVQAVLQRQERQLLNRKASVIQPEVWPEVEAVAPWLEVVWGNLVSNAVQHGAISPRLELGWSQNEREFRFWVSDNGGGVAPERLGGLFQPFHLLHHANARKGFGLSLVQRLVDLQGGCCGYEPSSAGGSTFFFTLPAEKCADASLSPTAIPDPHLRSEAQTNLPSCSPTT